MLKQIKWYIVKKSVESINPPPQLFQVKHFWIFGFNCKNAYNFILVFCLFVFKS